jgi:predicted peroxiredoxin
MVILAMTLLVTFQDKLMKPVLKTISTALLATGLMASPAVAGQKMLMLLSAPAAEAQAFNLVLANQLQASGHGVHVVLCGEAGDVALKAVPEAATKAVTPQGMTVRSLLEGLLKKGGTVQVCAIYLPNRKLQADALMEGVSAARPQDVAAMISDPAIKIMGQ